MFAHIILMFDYGCLNINKQVHGIQLNQSNSQNWSKKKDKMFPNKNPQFMVFYIHPTHKSSFLHPFVIASTYSHYANHGIL